MEPPPAEQAPQPQKTKSVLLAKLLLVAAVAAIAAIIVFAGTKLIQPKPPALYIDLGTQRFDPAGLERA